MATLKGLPVHPGAEGTLFLEDPFAPPLGEPAGKIGPAVLASPALPESPANHRPVEDVVVVGGGPAGLASAIRLAERGFPVRVLEIREEAYQRPHHLNLRQATLDSLEALGVLDRVMERSGPIQREESLHTGEIRTPQAESLVRGRIGFNARRLLGSDSVVQVRISDVEDALHERALELGVKVEKGWRADLEQVREGPEAGMFRLVAERVRRDGREGFQPTGETRDLGVPGLVLLAEGTNSPTRAKLGIEFEELSEPTWFLGGHVETGLGPVVRKALRTGEDGTVRKLMATGHGHYPQTWVSVQCRPELARAPHEERVQELCEQASFLLNTRLRPEDIRWGAGLVTVVQNRQADQAHAGLNVLLVGDTVRSGSVWASGGINLALGVDTDHVTTLVDEVNSGSRSRTRAMAAYDRKIAHATRAWHEAGDFQEDRRA